MKRISGDQGIRIWRLGNLEIGKRGRFYFLKAGNSEGEMNRISGDQEIRIWGLRDWGIGSQRVI